MIGGQAIRIVEPANTPVNLAELKEHLRVTHTDDDVLLLSYLDAGVQMVETYTGLGLLLQTWRQTFPQFPSATVRALTLDRRPLLLTGSPASAVEVSWQDGSGNVTVLDPGSYRLSGIGADKVPGKITLAYGAAWPTPVAEDEAITVTYTVGYGTAASSVPALIRQAVKMAAADYYLARENLSEDGLEEIPYSVRTMLRDWRPLAVA